MVKAWLVGLARSLALELGFYTRLQPRRETQKCISEYGARNTKYLYGAITPYMFVYVHFILSVTLSLKRHLPGNGLLRTRLIHTTSIISSTFV